MTPRPASALPIAPALLFALALTGCEPNAAVVAERDEARTERDALQARLDELDGGDATGAADFAPVLTALRDAGASVTETDGVVTAVAMPATSATTGAHLLPLLLMPELKILTLGGTAFDDDDMKIVGQLDSLERLDISGATSVRNEGFAHLDGLTNLKVLRMKTVAVSDLTPIEGMQDLRELDLRFSNADDGSMDSVAKLPNLATLKLERSAVTDEGLAKLSADQPIKALDLDKGFYEPLPIIVERFPDLRSLELDRSDLYLPEHFAPLAKLTELRSLSLQEAYAGDAELEPALKELTNLESLNLRQTSASDKLMPTVGKLTNLKTLNLAEVAGVTEDGLMELKGLTKLENLDLWDTGANDAVMQEVVAGFENLRALSLQKTAVGDEGIKALAGLENLQRLDLTETEITDESVATLKTLPNLTSLTLKNAAVSAEGIAELEEAKPDLQITQ